MKYWPNVSSLMIDLSADYWSTYRPTLSASLSVDTSADSQSTITWHIGQYVDPESVYRYGDQESADISIEYRPIVSIEGCTNYIISEHIDHDTVTAHRRTKTSYIGTAHSSGFCPEIDFSGAPWVRKFGNICIWEILGVKWLYAHLIDRPYYAPINVMPAGGGGGRA